VNRVRRSETAATVQRDATNPRVDGPAVLPLFCLAPHGVFLASRITPRAVSSYLAFSPLPVPLLPKNRRCLFCDTFRHRNPAVAALRRPRLLRGMLPYGVRTFLERAAKAAHQRSSAIGAEPSTESKIWKPGIESADFRNPWTVSATAFVLPASGHAIVRSRRGRGRARVSCNCIRTPDRAAPELRARAWASLRQTDLRPACLRPAVFRSVSDAEKNIRDRR
jgi:hypothetical protein